MSTDQILKALIEERDRIGRAIAALGTAKPAGAAGRHRTEAQKAAQSEKMKAYWAARKAAKKKAK